jgi:FAD/FMN-containing dehydrogenase
MSSKTPSSATIAQALGKRMRGEILTDERTLTRYATDMSMYRIRPLVVVFPQDLEDVVAVVHFARENGIPLTPRGGGTSTAGSALGRGILLAFQRDGPMNQVLDFDEVNGEPRVTVEPALLHDKLQAFLRERGLYLPADPSSGAVCLMGGNIATKASGPHALKHGSIDRYLRHLQFVTAEGKVVDTADEGSIPLRIRQGVLALRDEVLADAQTVRRLAARQDMKLASGYNLFTFVRHSSTGFVVSGFGRAQSSPQPNGSECSMVGDFVAQLLVGSVGTLGVITQATLRAEPYIEGKATMSLYFRDLREAGDAVQYIKDLGVAAIEIMNHRAIAIVKERRAELAAPEGESHMLLVEFEGPERHAQVVQVEELVRQRGYDLAWPPRTAQDEAEQAQLWKLRKSLLPTMRSYRRDRVALSLVNDVGVDVARLADFILDAQAIFERHGLVAGIYGHAGSGNLHLRPLFDPGDPDLPALLVRLADEVYETVFRYDGTITAEHGMGRLRTSYLAGEWGETIVGYMRRVKHIFDPDDSLNPDVMFSTRALTDDLKPLQR